MNNVFIMGKAGAGKDTVAEILSDAYDYKLTAFADNIRYEYGRFFDGKNARTDRGKLIEIGQTYKKLYGEDVWTRLLLKEIQLGECLADRFVVTDGRHLVEYDTFVIGQGYLPIWVDCPEEIRYERLLKRDGTLQEEALKKECQDLWDVDAYILDNSGTIGQLENRIATLMKYVSR